MFPDKSTFMEYPKVKQENQRLEEYIQQKQDLGEHQNPQLRDIASHFDENNYRLDMMEEYKDVGSLMDMSGQKTLMKDIREDIKAEQAKLGYKEHGPPEKTNSLPKINYRKIMRERSQEYQKVDGEMLDKYEEFIQGEGKENF